MYGLIFVWCEDLQVRLDPSGLLFKVHSANSNSLSQLKTEQVVFLLITFLQSLTAFSALPCTQGAFGDFWQSSVP